MAGGAEVVGATQVVQNLSKMSKAIIQEIVYGCEAVQANVKNNAKGRVPVLTGNLQGSITEGGIVITDDNVEATIIANADYATFVEFGTKRMSARPYLIPALLENIRTFQKAMVAAVKRGIETL